MEELFLGGRHKLEAFLAQTYSFFFVVEFEKGIQIFEGNETDDSAIVQKALKAVKMFRDINIFSD